MTLLLFDIDGTLVDAHGAGREAVEAAFRDVTGHAIDSGGVSFSGKTDLQIARELLAEWGDVTRDERDAVAARVLDRYAERLADALPHSSGRIEALPGTRALLERLSERGDVRLGLLTGNIEATAHLKLDAVGLGRFFSFGAFGSDEADRNRLVPVAARRAEAHDGRAFSGEEIVVIGDTPRDVACGAAHDTRTVGVCTGRYPRADLEDAGADHVFDDLADAEGFASALFEEA